MSTLHMEMNEKDTGGDCLKKNTMIKITGMLCCVGLLTGCAKTPESTLVKQKGEAAMDKYREADDNSETGQETGDGSSSGKEKTAALRTRLNAPETYQDETTDEIGKLKICTDAAVEIPEADKVPTIAVSQHPFDQSMIDQVTDGFFKGAKMYDYVGYVQWTKADWQKKLEELKGYRLDVPQATLVAYELQKKGVPLPDGILSMRELEQELEKLRPASAERTEQHGN